MDCSYFRERINEYIDGELDYLQVAELQAHLSFCPDCAVELAQTGELRGALAGWGRLELAPPPGFAERVMAAVELEPAPARPGRSASWSTRRCRSSTTGSAASRCPAAARSPSRTSSAGVSPRPPWSSASSARHERGSRELPL